MAATLQPLRAALTNIITSDLSGRLQPLVAALVGEHALVGQLGGTLQPLRAALSGQQIISGQLTGALRPLRAALTGTAYVDSTLTGALRPLVAALVGTQTQTGTLAGTLRALQFAGVGTHAQSGQMAGALQALRAAVTGTHILQPSETQYTASTTVNVATMRAMGYTHVLLWGVGGGEAGTNGGFITGKGGDSGKWNSATIALADYPSLTLLTVTVGAGGASNGADGAATTISGDGGMPTLTCAGGAGGSSVGTTQPGEGPGNFTMDGTLYTGGANQNLGSAQGNEPGGGGGGGNPFSIGGAGAKGRAWTKFKQI